MLLLQLGTCGRLGITCKCTPIFRCFHWLSMAALLDLLFLPKHFSLLVVEFFSFVAQRTQQFLSE